MKEDNEYIERLRVLLDSERYEASWESTRSYLEKKRKRRRRVAGLLVSGIAVFSLLLLRIDHKIDPLPGNGGWADLRQVADASGELQTNAVLPATVNETSVQGYPAGGAQRSGIRKDFTGRTRSRLLQTKPQAQFSPAEMGTIPEEALSSLRQPANIPFNDDLRAEAVLPLKTAVDTGLAALAPVSDPVAVTDTVNACIPGADVSADSAAVVVVPENHEASDTASDPLADERAGVLTIDSGKTWQRRPLVQAEAGLLYSAWEKGGPLNDRRLGPCVTLSYAKAMTRRWDMGFGIGYQSLSLLQAATIVSKYTVYSYGEESSVKAVTPLRLHYLNFPLRVGMQFKTGHSIWAAYAISYLFNAEARVDEYYQGFGLDKNHRSYIAGGYTDGFALFGSQVAVIYRIKMAKELYAQLDLGYGLSNLREKGFFPGVGRLRSGGVGFSLIYTLYKLK